MKTRCCCSKRYLLVFSILLVSVGSIFMYGAQNETYIED